jgi:hypothetical protein
MTINSIPAINLLQCLCDQELAMKLARRALASNDLNQLRRARFLDAKICFAAPSRRGDEETAAPPLRQGVSLL